ncbi:aminodeoxychorismate synthase component I [Paenibacillus sp. JX-17]|uniref:Aminodeoxychorismate synthase component I n=1 Tax=Paenibacillus lacisoli TaxID=3064525 RepID=A0ABT9CF82_9BACL|nr:aminodeoxychorismate synthase component I [Paenibacillus sp. JX-17]MDO7907912.1 aminodeoxychorismate synthase component I [Paenibacillus sp. JX-17]
MKFNKGDSHVHFRDRHGTVHNYIFQKPLEIYQADHLDCINAVLKAAERAALQGRYVVGYVAYEAAGAFDRRLVTRQPGAGPLAWFAVYAQAVPAAEAEAASISEEAEFSLGGWSANTLQDEYSEIIQRIKHHIAEGETYQTNYTIRMNSDFAGDDYAFYRQLCQNQQAAYSAYIHLGDCRVLSVSPELFFEVEDGEILTRPMKGTAPRGRWKEEDDRLREQLRHSDKDRAENVMIVDLLRNDLSRIAETGTVRVDKLFKIELYPTVFQMTSEVWAQTKCGLSEIFSALFPCGSITGAPKVSTMEIITEIEREPRGVYCGSIGLLLPGGHSIFNVAIRTVQLDKQAGKASYGAGGGITWDSSAEGEYQEVYNKAAVLTRKAPGFQLLETLRLERGEYDLLSCHLERMAASAAFFQYPYDEAKVLHELRSLVNHLPEARTAYRVRLLLAKDGTIQAEASALPSGDHSEMQAVLSSEPVNSSNLFLYHKTTHREVYNERKAEGWDETLLWNERGELTEFVIGNLVLEMNGRLYTPPVVSGLLGGTLRRSLLESGRITERVLYRSDLLKAEKIWLINSVRGWVPIRFGSIMLCNPETSFPGVRIVR